MVPGAGFEPARRYSDQLIFLSHLYSQFRRTHCRNNGDYFKTGKIIL
jgi:hypothetical protein